MRCKEHTFDMSVVLAVFQPPMFWLKADAVENICEPHRSMMQQVRNQRDVRRCEPHRSMMQQVRNQRDVRRSMLAERRHPQASRLEARSAAKRAIRPQCRHAIGK
jgi:hypothetical protein